MQVINTSWKFQLMVYNKNDIKQKLKETFQSNTCQDDGTSCNLLVGLGVVCNGRLAFLKY